MTEQEAIAIIKKNYPKCCKMVNGRYKGGFDDTDCELGQAFNIAIKALEEVQQYRAIGTPEELQAAMEKQIAKKPTYEGDGYSDGQLVYDTWICPCCGRSYELDNDDCDYCPNCGQNLDWSEENGSME